jgi:hypothetical protein
VKPSREFLGSDYSSYARRKVYLLVDALETDEFLSVRIERTRVYFDDVLAITYHQQRGLGVLLFAGIPAFFFGLMAIGLMLDAGSATFGVGIFFLVVTLLFVAVLVLRLAFPLSIISVQGRRTNTRMKFWLRQGRAQGIYARLVDEIQARQNKVAASIPPPPAPPEIPSPPPPAAAAPEPPPVSS